MTRKRWIEALQREIDQIDFPDYVAWPEPVPEDFFVELDKALDIDAGLDDVKKRADESR